MVPAGCEGRPRGHECVVEVNGGVHGIVVDADVAVGVAVADVEGEAGAGRAGGRVEAAGEGEGAMLNRGRCGRRLSQRTKRTTTAARRKPRRTEQRVLVKAAAQLSLVRRVMRGAWLLTGAGWLLIGAGCLVWCMLITN